MDDHIRVKCGSVCLVLWQLLALLRMGVDSHFGYFMVISHIHTLMMEPGSVKMNPVVGHQPLTKA